MLPHVVLISQTQVRIDLFPVILMDKISVIWLCWNVSNTYRTLSNSYLSS